MSCPAGCETRPAILLLSQQLGPGGTERQLAATALGLSREFAVHAGCFVSGCRAGELKAAGIPVVELPVRSFLSTGAVSGALRLAAYMRAHRIGLVHAFDYPMNCFAVPLARAARVPVVLSSQRGYRELVPPMYRRLLRLTDRIVDGVVVNCEAMRRHLIDDEGVSAARVHLCHNGIDVRSFTPTPRIRVPALQHADVVIGTVSVLRPEKDIGTLLEAFAAVSRATPGVRLAVVGSGPMREGLLARAAALGIAAQCVFEPATADVATWMRSMDIFVLPSRSEALSNSLMEAMACGCVPVASHVGGNPELVIDGCTGSTFPPGDVAALTSVLRRLVDDPELRRTMAAMAAEFIQKRFSLESAAERMSGIYRGLLAARRNA